MPSLSAVPATFMNGVISAIEPQSITRAPNAAAILSRTPGTDAPGSPEKNIVFKPNAARIEALGARDFGEMQREGRRRVERRRLHEVEPHRRARRHPGAPAPNGNAFARRRSTPASVPHDPM